MPTPARWGSTKVHPMLMSTAVNIQFLSKIPPVKQVFIKDLNIVPRYQISESINIEVQNINSNLFNSSTNHIIKFQNLEQHVFPTSYNPLKVMF